MTADKTCQRDDEKKAVDSASPLAYPLPALIDASWASARRQRASSRDIREAAPPASKCPQIPPLRDGTVRRQGVADDEDLRVDDSPRPGLHANVLGAAVRGVGAQLQRNNHPGGRHCRGECVARRSKIF